MSRWQITSDTGHNLGFFEGPSPADAIANMRRAHAVGTGTSWRDRAFAKLAAMDRLVADGRGDELVSGGGCTEPGGGIMPTTHTAREMASLLRSQLDAGFGLGGNGPPFAVGDYGVDSATDVRASLEMGGAGTLVILVLLGLGAGSVALEKRTRPKASHRQRHP